MFGIIADSLTTITSVLFPIFASYKAIRTSDPAQLTPWLMYWTTLSLFLAAESLAHPILSWVPFYSWIRFGVHLYLVLPGKQGSVYIYQAYIHPFLEEHEREIDVFISDSHERAKRAGLQYLKQAIEFVRVNVLHLQPKQPTPPPSRNVSYTQSLLGRFNMPDARPGAGAAGTGDLLSLLGTAMQQATYPSSRSRDAQVEDISASGRLIPPHIVGEERSAYVATQRARLNTLLQAFDKEAYETEAAAGASADRSHARSPSDVLKKSKSEAEFEDLAYEDLPKGEKKPGPSGEKQKPSWSSWVWGNYGEKDSALQAKKAQ